MEHDLMPVASEAPLCSEFARSIKLLPPGTGLFLTRIVLVAVPLPWPKPALKHPLITAAAGLIRSATVPTRLFAAEPVGEELSVTVYERNGTGAVHRSWIVADAAEVTSVVESILTTDVGQIEQVEPLTQPTFLVCTQGSHDTCCGVSGVALADQIASERPDLLVRRVSHTGGHRFSPTFVALPEGRMWAFGDLDLVDRIVAKAETAEDYRRRSRGWWGAPVGPAQVAEVAVRAERAANEFREPTVTPVQAHDATTTEFDVTVDNERWQVAVELTRTVPSISCESPGGEPAKPGREFGWSVKRSSDTSAKV